MKQTAKDYILYNSSTEEPVIEDQMPMTDEEAARRNRLLRHLGSSSRWIKNTSNPQFATAP